MHHLLFVCRGNTCRSPIAEALARALCPSSDIIIASAGVDAYEGARPTPSAILAMQLRGIDLSQHRSRQLTRQMVDESTAIFSMTRGRMNIITVKFPASKGKIQPLDTEHDVLDPIGGTVETYIETAERLTYSVRKRLVALGLCPLE